MSFVIEYTSSLVCARCPGIIFQCLLCILTPVITVIDLLFILRFSTLLKIQPVHCFNLSTLVHQLNCKSTKNKKVEHTPLYYIFQCFILVIHHIKGRNDSTTEHIISCTINDRLQYGTVLIHII